MDSQTYNELHGCNNWVNLLDPLDLNLRTLLISYGDLASAAERALNNDEGSHYRGYSRYGKSSFFKGAMLHWAESKYQVVSFIYATASVDPDLLSLFPGLADDGSRFESNWMGYVAVSSDEYSKVIGRREICVVWRGTARTYEWIEDVAGAMPVSAAPLLPDHANLKGTDTPHVMGGWLSLYNTSDPNSKFVKSSAQTQLNDQIKQLLNKFKHETVSITCTGHSLGACLTVLSAFDLARNVVKPDINVSAFIFACPQVGNQSFKENVEKQPNLKVLRVTNEHDIIPLWPSKIIKWVKETNTWVPFSIELYEYVDIGVEIPIDSNKSPYLKDESKNGKVHPLVFHNLQGMLHTLSGWNGKKGAFDWDIVKRSLGMVNMSTDLLKEEFKIPVNWWAEKNKGMVLNEHGDWVLETLDPYDHDIPIKMPVRVDRVGFN